MMLHVKSIALNNDMHIEVIDAGGALQFVDGLFSVPAPTTPWISPVRVSAYLRPEIFFPKRIIDTHGHEWSFELEDK